MVEKFKKAITQGFRKTEIKSGRKKIGNTRKNINIRN